MNYTKNIPWYDWLYQAVENTGVISVKTWEYISVFLSNGYPSVSLRGSDGIQKQKRMHRIMSITFIPNPKNLPEINHKDGNRLNFHTENLEWCTHSYNVAHAFRTGLTKSHLVGMKWDKHYQAQPVLQYSKDGVLIREGECMKDASQTLSISSSQISACCRWVRSHKTARGFIFKYA